MSDLATPPKRRPFVEGCICVARARSYAPRIAHDPRRLAILCVPNVPGDVRHVLTRITSTVEGGVGRFPPPSAQSFSVNRTHALTRDQLSVARTVPAFRASPEVLLVFPSLLFVSLCRVERHGSREGEEGVEYRFNASPFTRLTSKGVSVPLKSNVYVRCYYHCCHHYYYYY